MLNSSQRSRYKPASLTPGSPAVLMNLLDNTKYSYLVYGKQVNDALGHKEPSPCWVFHQHTFWTCSGTSWFTVWLHHDLLPQKNLFSMFTWFSLFISSTCQSLQVWCTGVTVGCSHLSSFQRCCCGQRSRMRRRVPTWQSSLNTLTTSPSGKTSTQPADTQLPSVKETQSVTLSGYCFHQNCAGERASKAHKPLRKCLYDVILDVILLCHNHNRLSETFFSCPAV